MLLKIHIIISILELAQTFEIFNITDKFIFYPKFYSSLIRKRRDINSNTFYNYDEIIESIEIGNNLFEFKTNKNLIFGSDYKVETSNGTVLQKSDCRFLSSNEANYFTILSVCGENISGLVTDFSEYYFIEPFKNSGNAHVIYKSDSFKNEVKKKRVKRDIGIVCGTTDFDNIYGNINITENLNDQYEIEENSEEVQNVTLNNETHDDINGYFYDSTWEAHVFKKKRKKKMFTLKRYLEIAIGVDHSVISFHGLEKVQHYILALMNIVSAIYQDPSLDSNLQMVITRMLLYDNKRDSQIKEKNARKSLENVNAWNRRLHATLKPGESRHDLAIWLTKLDLGGPSGYAPVGGVCNPVRSCTLNRDEGLTSSFIIAHEMAHILGLSHDGDKKSGNRCSKDAQLGSVMAPMVMATFNKFHWSTCSRREFHKTISSWSCLMNSPQNSGEHVLKAILHTTFSMEDQCRMEFGEGYGQCTSLEVIDPCSHLWCSHKDSHLVCKTKKGPPLEGTSCGLDKWCKNGYCQYIDITDPDYNPILHNPQDGGWSDWSTWKSCSRTCGFGVQFRIRNCDNPKPMYGGSYCEGLHEEFRICGTNSCPEPLLDFREEQCSRLNKIVDFANTTKENMTWLAHEPSEDSLKCQLVCRSKQTGELFFSGENLIDGTACSYDKFNYICIQGDCQNVGCDGVLFSEEIQDKCGVCKGDNTTCKHIKREFQRNLKKEISRILVIPRLSRDIYVACNITTVWQPLDSSVKLQIRDRRKNKYEFIAMKDELVVKGAKFIFQKKGNLMEIKAKGPTLAELIISLSAPSTSINKGISMHVEYSFVTPKKDPRHGHRYVWEYGGFGPCSVSCGGGRKQRTIACRDNVTKTLVQRRLCPLADKPDVATQECNTFNCRFKWHPGNWEHCSTTCGSRGVQNREVYCVPVQFESGHPWKVMVAPDRCLPGDKPETERTCNRIACPSHWQINGWSQCSATCGHGVKMLQYTCPALQNETLYSCGPQPMVQKRSCRKKKTSPLCRRWRLKRCKEDSSQYCSLTDLLSKYCIVPQYRRLCCKSCKELSE